MVDEEEGEEGQDSEEDDVDWFWPSRRRRNGPRPVIYPVRFQPNATGQRLARSGEFGLVCFYSLAGVILQLTKKPDQSQISAQTEVTAF